MKRALLASVLATVSACTTGPIPRSTICVEVNNVVLHVACVDGWYVDPCTGDEYQCTVGQDTCAEAFPLYSETCD